MADVTPAPRPAPAQRAETPKLPFPLQDGESVFKIARRHWIYLWPYLLLQVAIAIIPVLIVRWLLDKAGILDDIGDAIWIATVVWVLFWLARAGLNWYRYRHDLWTITNQRLIDSYRSHPFDLRVSTADLVNVQDMSIVKRGILSTLLDYGDIVWVLFWLARAGLNWYRYRHDLWTITNQRLIDSYRSHPFDLRVSTADLVNVQDMSIVKRGILSTLLDYGDIVCQTASSTGEFRLTGIPKPRETQILVDRERDRERMRTRGS